MISVYWYWKYIVCINMLVSITCATVFELFAVVSIWWYCCWISCISMLVSFKRLDMGILYQYTGINEDAVVSTYWYQTVSKRYQYTGMKRGLAVSACWYWMDRQRINMLV